jgi:opacity protein-like surface antigen
VRKCLGVLAVTAVLCAMSWAQAPDQTPPSTPPDTTQTPPTAPEPTQPVPQSSSIPIRKLGPQFPRVELFAGYSFAQAGFFNSGHWAQLNGFNVSFGVNLTDHVGFVIDGSQYLGNSQINTNAPAPFQPCVTNCPTGPTFNADTKEYNILFGLQFPFHRRERWTPFGEIMFGHDGVRGQALRNNITDTVVSSGLALLAGAGADYKINERFALRFKADYLNTRTSFPAITQQTYPPPGRLKQDNFRMSVGVVIRSVRKKKRTLEEDTE